MDLRPEFVGSVAGSSLETVTTVFSGYYPHVAALAFTSIRHSRMFSCGEPFERAPQSANSGYGTVDLAATGKTVNGTILSNPEALAGRWEAADARGGVVGMNILLTKFFQGTPETLAGQPQYEEEFIVGLYQRTGPDVEELGFDFFTAAPNGGASWDGHRLGISLIGKADLPTIHVDLAWDPDSQTWRGLFERGAFGEQVVLRWPVAKTPTSPFVGTWFEKNGIMNNCLHLAQQQDGTWTGWSDDIMVPGRMRYANGIHPPAQLREHYGEIAKAKMDAPDQITVELRAYTAICCSHPFTAKIAENGMTLSGIWPSGPNQAPRAVEWEKMSGDSCIMDGASR